MMRKLLYGMITAMACISVIVTGQEKEETIVCPGRGERCAYVEILGIKIWSKKDKGSPGIIIKKTLNDEQ